MTNFINKLKMSAPEPCDEEFNNFMHKVTQVNNIVQKLASKDKSLQEIGDLEAKEYLGEANDEKYENLNEDDIKIKTNRTIINRKALLKEDNPQTQSQEAFMEEVAKDADKRYKDKLKRKERMETLKKQANLAFRRGEFERALMLNNKAIEQIKDSCLLYTNRALTYMNLKFYDKAIDDLKRALQLNENSLKANLLLAKAYFYKADKVNFNKIIQDLREKRDEDDFINNFLKKLELEANEADL